MSPSPLVFALPSKGRLKDQVEAWLTDCGFKMEVDGGERGYRARIGGLPGVEVRLLSAADIAQSLDLGEAHLGVTGEDLLRERGGDLDARVMMLRALGFGRADLVVAAPQSWIDVETMMDLDDVAHAYLARTGRRLRVATKYHVQTRRFFAEHGIADYRIVDSLGATEGAPAAGAAELVVDISSSGATLTANNLKILSDGVILRSEAHLAASLAMAWTAEQLATLTQVMSVIEARADGRDLCALRWPNDQAAAAERAVSRYVDQGATRRTDGVLVRRSDLFDICAALGAAGVGPVSVTRPDYVFTARSEAVERLRLKVRR
jgi:ATP phosphoribosyltransferase